MNKSIYTFLVIGIIQMMPISQLFSQDADEKKAFDNKTPEKTLTIGNMYFTSCATNREAESYIKSSYKKYNQFLYKVDFISKTEDSIKVIFYYKDRFIENSKLKPDPSFKSFAQPKTFYKLNNNKIYYEVTGDGSSLDNFLFLQNDGEYVYLRRFSYSAYTKTVIEEGYTNLISKKAIINPPSCEDLKELGIVLGKKAVEEKEALRDKKNQEILDKQKEQFEKEQAIKDVEFEKNYLPNRKKLLPQGKAKYAEYLKQEVKNQYLTNEILSNMQTSSVVKIILLEKYWRKGKNQSTEMIDAVVVRKNSKNDCEFYKGQIEKEWKGGGKSNYSAFGFDVLPIDCNMVK